MCRALRFQRVRGGKERPAGAGAMDEDDDGPPDDANEMSRVSCILQVCALRDDTLVPQGVVSWARESPPLILQAWAVHSIPNPNPAACMQEPTRSRRWTRTRARTPRARWAGSHEASDLNPKP